MAMTMPLHKMRFAYADPPYLGQAKRLYQSSEVDHSALIQRLVDEFPDGFALSCSSPSLRVLLPQCPADSRVGAWVKPFAFFHSGLRGKPPFAWEPVIWRTCRATLRRSYNVRDFLIRNAYGVTATERAVSGNVKGMKPPEFCLWIFELLGMPPDDELVDLFPGSGTVTRTWKHWRRQRLSNHP